MRFVLRKCGIQPVVRDKSDVREISYTHGFHKKFFFKSMLLSSLMQILCGSDLGIFKPIEVQTF